MSATSRLDQAQIVAELRPSWLAGLAGGALAEGEQLLSEVVADWALEADASRDPQATLRIQRGDLEAMGNGKAPAERLGVLRLRAIGRRVEHAGTATFALARAIIDGNTSREAARPEGRALLARLEALAAEVKALPPGESAAPIRAELSEATMEALFVVDGKAASLRLGRYQQEKQGGPPPGIR